MAYENMLDVVVDLYSDLKKKRERLLNKKQKLDVELLLIDKAHGCNLDLEEEQRKVESKLWVVNDRLKTIEKSLNGNSTLDSFIPELKKMGAKK